MRSTEYLYRPQHKNRKELINDFVIRNDIYQRMLDSIKSETVKDPSQHILVEGKRGMGKTTLMLRLTYELQNTDTLKKRFVPCKFNEEEYGIGSLAILWERIAEHLEEDERFEGILDIFDDIENSNGEEQFIKEVRKWLEEKKVIAVVFIDNFFQIIEKFTKQDQQRLREELIKTPYLKIIAGSARFMEKHAGNYAAPFFEFFKREKLDKLSASETKELLVHLANKHKAQNVIDTMKNEPHRIDNIRILCGGVPRTLVTFFEVLMDDVDGNSIDDLKLVMDRVNELYLQRMNSLSKKEQPIINAMALHWEAISTGALAEKLGETSKSISSILNKLEKQQIIERIKTDTKNHLWRIEERFFNIWYLLTQAPRRYQKKVKWLTAFIEALYSEDDFSRRLKSHLAYLSTDYANPEHAIILSNAFLGTKYLRKEDRDEIVVGLRGLFDKKAYDSSELPRTNEELRKLMFDLIRRSKFKRVDALLHENENLFNEIDEVVVDSFRLSGVSKEWNVDQIRDIAVGRVEFSAYLFDLISEFNAERNSNTRKELLKNDLSFTDPIVYGCWIFLRAMDFNLGAFLVVFHVLLKLLEADDSFQQLVSITSDKPIAQVLLFELYAALPNEYDTLKTMVASLDSPKILLDHNWIGLRGFIIGKILNGEVEDALNVLDRALEARAKYLEGSFKEIAVILVSVDQLGYLQSRSVQNGFKDRYPEIHYFLTSLNSNAMESLVIPPELNEPIEKMYQEVENWKRVFAEHST